MAVALAIGLVVAGAGPIAAAPEADEAPPTLLEQFIDQAERIGKGKVTIAVVRAADRGYDLAQVLQGVFSGSMAADGTVTEDGDPVAPSQPPAGVITGNAAATGGPGAARGPRVRTADDVTLPELERGVKKAQRQLEPLSLGRIADGYGTTSDVAAMLVILALANEGYSIEQIIVDGIMGAGIDAPIYAKAVIRDRPGGKGDIVTPEFAKPPIGGDADDADAISDFLDGVVEAVAGEDPLVASDDSFKREYTLTIGVEVAEADASLRIEGKANAGAVKGLEDAGIVIGRGTGSFSGEGACRTTAGPDTDPYPYTLSAPVQVGVRGAVERGSAQLAVEARPSSRVRVQADGDSFCLGLVRDGADSVISLIDIPTVTVRWKDGASATAKGTTYDGAGVFVEVSVRKI